MPPECQQPKLYRVWHRPHGSSHEKPPNARESQDQQGQTQQPGAETEPFCPADPGKTGTLAKWQAANVADQETKNELQKPRESSQRSSVLRESHRLSVRFSPTVCLASATSAARTSDVPGGNLSHSQKLHCNEGISNRNSKEERCRLAKTKWSPWRDTSSLADAQHDPLLEMNSPSRSPGCPEGNNMSDTLELATSQKGIKFSVSETEVVIEVPWSGVAWGEASLKNEGNAAFFFSLRRQKHEQGYQQIQGLPGFNMSGNDADTGFCAWPLHGVVLPGEAETLHFGYHFNRRSGLQYCDWELYVTLSNGAAKSARVSPPQASEAAYTTRISIIALVSASPIPLEGLWHQCSRASRWQALAAAEDVVQLLLEETHLYTTKPKEVPSCMDDPLARATLFGIANAPLGITAPPDVVDAFLLLQHQISGLLDCEGQQLELLQRSFSARHDEKKSTGSKDTDEQATGEAESQEEETLTEVPTAGSLSDALAAAKADMRAFSVDLLQKQILQLSPEEQEKSQDCFWALRKLLMECDDSQPAPQDPVEWLDRSPFQLLQEGQEVVNAAEEALCASLSHALEMFPSVFSEALEMTGLTGVESEEKGRQGQRSSRRQVNKGRHDSKVSEDPSGSSTAAAAAVAAAAAAISANGIVPEEEGPRTRQHVAEQLLQWLLSEAVAAAEPQLMLQAAEKTAAWGGANAEAARLRLQKQPACESLELQLQRTPLPSCLDRRVLRMAEYLSRKQAPTVKECTRAVVLFDGKTTEDLLSLLQQQPDAEKQIWMQQLLQDRLGYLGDLLPQAGEGVLLCLEISPQQQQKLQLQHPLLLQQLMQELVEESLLPAVLGDDPQQYQVPVACLDTAEEIASFVESAAAKKGIGVADDSLGSGEGIGQDDDNEDFEDAPSLLVVPSWQQFFSAATKKLEDLQREAVLGASEIALAGAQKEDSEDAAAPTEAGRSNYLSAQRQLSKLSELLDIDFVALDSPCYVYRTAEESTQEAGEVALKDPQIVAAAAAAETASSPWLLQGPTIRALGPYVVAYLRAACLLLGIDPAALQQRAAEAVVDWREERHRRQSLDAAAASAKRQMQRHLECLCTDNRSCCCSNRTAALREATENSSCTLTPESMNDAEPPVAPVIGAGEQQAKHTATAVLCAYWDRIVPSGPGTTALEEAVAEEPLFKWASLQLQKLRMLVSGTIVSNILLAGDLISLICGLALNGDVVLEVNAQETPGQEEVVLSPQQEADAAAAAAAATAAAGAGGAPTAETGLPRGWLRLCRAAAEESPKPNTSGVTQRSCSIHPRVYNLRQVRNFVQTQLRTILEIAKEREVAIQLPTEVLLQVDPQPAALATAAPAATAEAAPRGRRTSDGAGGNQRNNTKKPRSAAKVESLEGHAEDAGAGDAAGAPPAEEEKQQPVLAVCHLPPADLLWKVVLAEGNDPRASPDEETNNNTATRRRSEEGMEPSKACGTYAALTQQAVENAVACFGGPSHVLWLGDKLNRETEGTQNLLDAAGLPDATVIMVESLMKAKNLLENSFSSPDDDFGYRAPSADSVLLESSSSFDASSSQISMMSDSDARRISMSNAQEKLGTEHLLLFGSIARNSWAFTDKGTAKVEAFLDEEPLLQMLQGRRVKDILLADNMFMGQGNEENCTGARTKVQTVYNFQLKRQDSS
ncbi:uncharacterized protein EMH_0083460 [Eimeria mitis]|uniref:Uncharacterized protein n=1 Tax=Eimeria mitis TaxID=44415 RepID=U6JUP3_9EIME|nr:uncharacterized protein EMH_0083460 [Eimeria mitis]CDJ27243.1 hypothetical protein, conserved [Eimeria mitis]